MNLKKGVLFVILWVYVDTSDPKCQLPSERRQTKFKTPRTDFPDAKLSITIKKLKRLRQLGALNKKIKRAQRIVKRYCRPPLQSSFEGFKLKNFQKTSLCPGKWDKRKIPKFYTDENDLYCWTLKNFLKYECPTFNCLKPRCDDNILRNIENKTTPRVVYQCQITSFVDIPFIMFCYNPKGSQFKFKDEKITVSRCCECTKLTCTEK